MNAPGVAVAADSKKARRRLPVTLLEGVRAFDKKRFPTEIVAGITLACLAIPEVMGYTSIAGMPVVTGLSTIVLPFILFALLGSSRHLVVGADSASAAIMYADLAAGNIEDLDFSGSAVLQATSRELGKHGVTLVACDLQGPVHAQLERDGLLDLIGDGFVFADVNDVLRAYQALPPSTRDDPGQPAAAPDPAPTNRRPRRLGAARRSLRRLERGRARGSTALAVYISEHARTAHSG